VNEKRSCIVLASKSPTHIIDATSASHQVCGIKSQPWIVEAADGQKIRIALVDFNAVDQVSSLSTKDCLSYGFIVDKPGKRNISICSRGEEREKELLLSIGSRIEIYITRHTYDQKSDNQSKFIIKIEG